MAKQWRLLMKISLHTYILYILYIFTLFRRCLKITIILLKLEIIMLKTRQGDILKFIIGKKYTVK